MTTFAEAIRNKLATEGISATAAARQVGLSLPAFRAVLKGESVPNARSLSKYAALLGLSVEEVQKLLPERSGEEQKRAPTRSRSSAARNRSPTAARILAFLEQAEAIMNDRLAVMVHRLPKEKRATIGLILQSME
ncbi:MAG: helix-turn-helix transcriptional regulator [Planctomycetota bacterium]|nr:helix-turn-helix domain-containing protein [Planctomycetota bacterium]MDW8372580.1 helix-turn-helix transcriptional regulator [Planctomycetota bacterium]